MSKKVTLSKILKMASLRIFDYDINTKLKKDDIIDLSTRVAYYINSSMKNLKASRLEGLPSNEEIVIDSDEKDYRIETNINKSTVQKTITLLSEIDENNVQTVLIPIPKKKSGKIDEHPFIKWLKDISTFEAVYDKIKERWIDLNDDDKTEFSNVLYLPDIYVFMNGKKIRTKPFRINLVIVAVPNKFNAKPGIDEMNEYEYIHKVVDDSIEATIKLTEKYITPSIKSIVFIASSSATTGSEFPEYVASKGGIVAYMKNVALRVAKYGATANSISPGGVITPLNSHILEDEKLYEAVLDEALLHKWATAEEIAEFAYFVTVVNKSMTGEDIFIDNGEKLKSNFIW